MTRIAAGVRRFCARTRAEQRALVTATLAQVFFTALVRVAPLPVARRLAARRRTMATAARQAATLRMQLWALDAAAPFLGGAASCLGRALAAQWLAGRHAVAAPLSIGVARAGTQLTAHAWIASHDVSVGTHTARAYTLLFQEPTPQS